MSEPSSHAGSSSTGSRDEETTRIVGGSASHESGAAIGPSSHRASSVVAEGARVGRYVVLERIGEGGMGVVLRAYDPKLRREIALKVMRPSTKMRGGEGQQRMLREAQALARLNDPHVVAVYDAEITDDGVYIAMEYVEGRTLRAWLREGSHTWREALEMVLAAARGLAAAHRAGVVHRDVKPGNVLIGEDGRVRLTDFGLAREDDDPPPGSESFTPAGEQDEETDGSSPLTQVGTVLGTPAYMAPEQHERQVADARSDQYALCVMLWEALYGRRPFQGANEEALAEAKLRGPALRPSTSVPEWMHTLLLRGLCVDPGERWTSVDALVDAFASGQGKARRRRVFTGLGLATCTVLAGVSWQQWQRARQVTACEEAGASVSEVWNDDARTKLRTAMIETGVSHADATADRVMPWLDAQAEAWQAARTEACLDAEVHGTWDLDMLDRALWCLDERWMELDALVTELSSPEARNVQRAVQAAAALGRVTACRNVDVLRRPSNRPEERRDEVRAVRAELSRAGALERTGAYDEGLAVARQALLQAKALGWKPLVATALLRVGSLLERKGEYVEAKQVTEAAFFEAAKAGASEVAAPAAVELVLTIGMRLGQPEEGLGWSRHAEVALASLPDVAGLQEASHLNNLGLVHHANGSTEEAIALLGRALAIREEALGSEHPDVAAILNNLASVYSSDGPSEEAKALLERALAIWEQTLGPEHPDVAVSLNNLAGIEYATGSPEAALPLFEQALATWEKTLGPDHPNVATCLINLGSIQASMKSFAEAKRFYARALDIRERMLGPEHPEVMVVLDLLGRTNFADGTYDVAEAFYARAMTTREETLGPEHADVAVSLVNLAQIRQAQGSFTEAEALLERALVIREKALGPESVEVAMSLDNLATVHVSRGAFEEAGSLFSRALAIVETTLGDEHPHLAHPLVGLTRVGLAQGRGKDVVPLAERALELRERGEAPPEQLAEARFVLAKALWEASRASQRPAEARTRAVELVRRARDDLQGDPTAELAEDVNAWLTMHEAGK
jgi:eukaryotic-like serine/threonine-protein kinase